MKLCRNFPVSHPNRIITQQKLDSHRSIVKQSINLNLYSHLLFSLGTHFDEAAMESLINVTIQDGKTAFLNCKINLLQDKTVNWAFEAALLCSSVKIFPYRAGIVGSSHLLLRPERHVTGAPGTPAFDSRHQHIRRWFAVFGGFAIPEHF